MERKLNQSENGDSCGGGGSGSDNGPPFFGDRRGASYGEGEGRAVSTIQEEER